MVSVVSRQVDFSDKPKYRTEINLTRFKDQGVEYERLMRYTGPEHFVAAAVDRAGRRAFLTPARPPVVYVADFQSNKKPVPTPWLELEESASISSLHYDQTTDQLYATDGLGSRLFAVDTKSPDPRPQVVAQSLGVPTRIAGGPTGERLYVADSEGLQVWSIDCAGVGECSTPEVFVRDEAFSNLSDLVVAPDGTVWVGDIEAQRIFGFNADGQLEQMYAELPPH